MKAFKVLILAAVFFSCAALKDKSSNDLIYSGLAYEESGEIDSAIKSYTRSLEVGENSIALFRLGKIYRKERQYQKAIDCFQRLIEFDSSVRLAYYYLSDCFLKQKQYERAYQYLSKAINFYPKSQKVKAALAGVKKALGRDFFISKKKLIDEQRKKIKLTSYFPKKEFPQVSVGLAINLKQFSFSCPGSFLASDGNISFNGEPKVMYTVTLDGGKLVLKDYQGSQEHAAFSHTLKISSVGLNQEDYPFYILDLTYGKGNFWQKTIDRAYRGDIEAVVKNGTLVLINRLSVEEYLYGVLSAEIPPDSHTQALKSQAVAARTLAFKNQKRHKKEGFDFCADVHCQVYQGISAETAATTQAVDETCGEILEFEGQSIEAFYHSNCGGCLASDVFGHPAYLVNQLDSDKGSLDEFAKEKEEWFLNPPKTFCSGVKTSNYRWQRIYDAEDFLFAFDFKLSDLKEIVTKETGECFHTKEVEVVTAQGRKTLRGDLAIRNYFDNLRSSAFQTEIKLSSSREPSFLIFWGAGFGHGSGLCQEGAIGMAEEGYGYQEILEHYYPKASLKKLY